MQTHGKILISRCTIGIYLRWWRNGWHHYLFTNGYQIEMVTESMGFQTTNFFSTISKTEIDTRVKSEYSYKVTLEGVSAANIPAFTGLLMAERVEQYEDLVWREIDITRGTHTIKDAGENGYQIEFEITRKELPGSSSVYQKALSLYLGDVLCDMDDDEIVPINKQVNNIAEMQDRQSDFTGQFKIRKTRAMKELFELSGEVGATTAFPYQRQPCRLVQDNIEIITGGLLILDKVEDQYYIVSILSGNINFFNLIAGLKISDLSLPSCSHTWDIATMAASHSEATPNIDYCYPLCEPSDDGSIAPQNDDGTKVEMYGGWIWPFVRVKAIWDEIFLNAGFTIVGGEILNSDKFYKMFMPISNRGITNTDKYLYSSQWGGNHYSPAGLPPDRMGEVSFTGVQLIKGDTNFKDGYYILPYSGKYKMTLSVQGALTGASPTLSVYVAGLLAGTMTEVSQSLFSSSFEYEIPSGVAGQTVEVFTSQFRYYSWIWQIVEIKEPLIGYSSIINAALHLPDMTQIDFVKMVCNLFALVPDVNPRNRQVRFWNYNELYENIPNARNWSGYLSEREDEVEFKFGDYAQNNYLKYKQSDDVLVDNGTGNLPFDDETLPEEKDIVQLVLSTCDEVTILTTNFSVDVSRIAFNKWNNDTAAYDSQKSINPRIVYIDYCREIGSPPYHKSLWLRATAAPLAGIFAAPALEIPTPKISKSIDVSFSSLILYYSSLSRLLTKPNLRRCKFNLPVYEVAGLKHNIPIYLSQYKAYFYVNKVSNYVPGQLCTIELIRL
jgi:hypothetical protein